MYALANGRRLKCLTCVDDFTKECLTITTALGISGVQVTRILCATTWEASWVKVYCTRPLIMQLREVVRLRTRKM